MIIVRTILTAIVLLVIGAIAAGVLVIEAAR